MIGERTVFVTGAGASTVYGFPTGFDLARKISGRFVPGNAQVKQVAELTGVPEDVLTDFGHAFHHSGLNSVDAFLQRRTDLIETGRLAIASCLIEAEDERELFKFDGWLRHVYARMDSPFEDFPKNRISFITFNYDRTIEQFLFLALYRGHNKAPHEVAAVIDQIPIIHLHGVLGALPWQQNARVFQRAYSADLTTDALRIASRGVKIIHEDIKDGGRDEDFKAAKKLLAEADRIFFLGFGFNPLNVERLGIAELTAPSVATSVGLTGAERSALQRLTNHRIQFEPIECVGMLRNVWAQ